jgi:hypothetical protein
VQTPELDAGALLKRIANALGDCLAIGSLNPVTGALGAYVPRSELWTARLSQAGSGTGSIFPGVRLGAIAALLTKISVGKGSAAELDEVSLAAEDARIVFQPCPWNTGEVLFVVLPEDLTAVPNFVRLRVLLESVRRDVTIVCAPRVEERCWN